MRSKGTRSTILLDSCKEGIVTDHRSESQLVDCRSRSTPSKHSRAEGCRRVCVGAIVEFRGHWRLLHVCISPTQLQVVLACFQHFRHICARLDTTPFLTSILKKITVVRRGGISATIAFGWMHSSLIRAKPMLLTDMATTKA